MPFLIASPLLAARLTVTLTATLTAATTATGPVAAAPAGPRWLAAVQGALVLAGLLALGTLALHGVRFAPWVPSRGRDQDRALDAAGVRPGDLVMDLGCGDGRLVCAAAQRLGVRALGVEVAWPLALATWLRCRALRWRGRGDRGRVRWASFWSVSVREASVVFLYGMPTGLSARLRAKLAAELRPGARVVAYRYPPPGWRPDRVAAPAGEYPVYVYVMPPTPGDAPAVAAVAAGDASGRPIARDPAAPTG